MNDGVTISTMQLFSPHPDAAAARLYLEARRWDGEVDGEVWVNLNCPATP